MSDAQHHIHVVLAADDPVEAGMLALELVQTGFEAQAVRDEAALLRQIGDVRAAIRDVVLVVVAAYRGLERTVALSNLLGAEAVSCAFIALIDEDDEDDARLLADEAGWLGVALRGRYPEGLVELLPGALANAEPPKAAAVSRRGSLEDTTLEALLGELLDPITGERRGHSAQVRLTAPGRSGLIVVRSGQLVHAVVDQDEGRHALERMFCWRSGGWEFETAPWAGTPTIGGSSRGIVAAAREYSRRVAEARQNIPYAHSVCTVRWERVRPLPAAAETMFRRIASGMVLEDALDGEGDDELEAYAALESRIKRGAVEPVSDSAAALASSDSEEPSRAGRRPSTFSAVPMSLVDSPKTAPRPTRHANTSIYRLEDLPDPDALPGAKEDAPERRVMNTPVLPQTLPEDPHTSAAPELLEPRHRKQAAFRNTSGWFGVNLGDTAGAGEVPFEPGRVARITEAVARVQRAEDAARHEDQGVSFEEWSEAPLDGAAADAAEAAAAQVQKNAEERAERSIRRRRQTWVIASVVIVAAALYVVLWPTAGPEANQIGRHNPVAPATIAGRTYRQALDLIDLGRDEQAVALLRRVLDTADSVPEARLQLGVMLLIGGDYDAGREQLMRYLADPSARERERALRLFNHVFGGQERAAQATGGLAK